MKLVKTYLRELSDIRRSGAAEITEFTSIARRIATILLLQPNLDENYTAVKAAPQTGQP